MATAIGGNAPTVPAIFPLCAPKSKLYTDVPERTCAIPEVESFTFMLCPENDGAEPDRKAGITDIKIANPDLTATVLAPETVVFVCVKFSGNPVVWPEEKINGVILPDAMLVIIPELNKEVTTPEMSTVCPEN